jgi:TonB family protein
MNIFVIYMVKAAIYLVAFYLIYAALLSRDTLYSRNRSFILVSLAASLILPNFTIQTLKPHDIQFFGKLLSEVFVTAKRSDINSAASLIKQVDILQVIYTVYLIGTITFIIKLIINLANLLILIYRHRNTGSQIIKFHGFTTAGFSAMGYVFINSRLNPEEAGSIVRHEQNHLKRNHFSDILFIELIKSVQWFNPAIYLFDSSLRAVHEFQADQECISSGVPVLRYQSLLLSQVFKSGTINLTNSFSNPSLIKRRMIMMTKKRTSALSGIKLLTVIPVTAIVFFAISAYKEIPESSFLAELQAENQLIVESLSKPDVQKPEPVADLKVSNAGIISSSAGPATFISSETAASPPPPPPPDETRNDETRNEVTRNDQYSEEPEPLPQTVTETEPDPFIVVEEMPRYPGGDAELLRYIRSKTIYPNAAREENIQGKVIIRFCVTENGGISRVSILKGVSPVLDAEAMRVVAALPEFIPGRQGDRTVPVWYSVPITFTLI